MLSEAERRKLTAIESRLRLDDPVFVERFTDTSKRRPHRGRRGTATLVALIAAVVAAAVGLVLSSVVTVVIALTAIGAVVGLWITAGNSGRSTTGPTGGGM